MNETTGTSLRILVVDDCPDIRASLSMLLRCWGHEVCAVGDGPTCLDRVGDYHPHVVLLDIGLPGMDGCEVARRLRAHPSSSPPRLVSLSGHGLEEDFHRSHAAGCDRHMLKPVDLMDLRLLLMGYADRARRETLHEAGVE